MIIDIGKSWKYTETVASDEIGIPPEAIDVDLPVDLLRGKSRNYHSALGEHGSFYDGVAAIFYKQLPRVDKFSRIVLEIEGVNQFADVYLGGVLVSHAEGAGKHFIDITRYYRPGEKNILKLYVWAPQLAGRYVGAGISGGVWLHTYGDSAAIVPDGAFATSSVSGGKAVVTLSCEIEDTESKYLRKTLVLEAVIKNARGKKAARKLKKVKIKHGGASLCEIKFHLSRFYLWSVEDPYVYTVSLNLRDGDGNLLDEGETLLGIVDRQLSPTRGVVLNGRGVKLKGAVVMQDNGILGAESLPSAEEYKLGRIKAIGYNAVRFIGCPTEAALCATDKLGLYTVVDLFSVWSQGKYPYDGHTRFEANGPADCERFIRQIRKHPSVVVYGLGDDAAEVYGRGDGSMTTRMLADVVKAADPSRPVCVNARERVPLLSELSEAGIKNSKIDENSALSLGREKDLFGIRTADSFACGDIAGYSYLYPRYSSDRTAFPGRLILGTAAYPSRAFEAFDECDKNSNVVGEFLYCGADYLGYPLGKPTYEDEQLKLLPPHSTFCGDLDLIYNRKTSACYRRIMFGNRSESYIVVSDPEVRQMPDKAGYSVLNAHAVWNWPRNLGKPIEVRVFSGGEVVALYRDGRLLGRKLAGKVNKHVATFRTEYYPGTLEAVSYHKGRECSRVQLQSVTAPRGIKLTCAKKAAGEGELLFVEISIVDKEGRIVPYASRDVEVTVSGQGELYALGCADPECQSRTSGVDVCHVYEGRALAVIKASGDGDGKIVVKAVSGGLLSGKISLRVR